MIYAIIQTPPGSTLEHTNAMSQRAAGDRQGRAGHRQSVSSLAGYEVLTEGRGSNAGTCLINLKPWAERKESVARDHRGAGGEGEGDPGAIIEFFEPPAVPGYGAAGGFSLRLLDKTNTGDYKALEQVTDEFMAELKKRKELTGLFTFFAANYPQYELIIDNELAMQKGVSHRQGDEQPRHPDRQHLRAGLHPFQRFFKVYVQASPEFRRLPEDMLNMFVQERQGRDGAVLGVHDDQEDAGRERDHPLQPVHLGRHPRRAGRRATAAARPSRRSRRSPRRRCPAATTSTGRACRTTRRAAATRRSIIFLIVLAFVYLVLAAQYESFLLPLAVILSLPAGVFGSFLLLKLMGLANDIYAQVGLVMLVGLLGKNAVLIVEFAVQKHAGGHDACARRPSKARRCASGRS